MLVNKTSRLPQGRNVLAFSLLVFALLAGIMGWMLVSAGSRPVAAAATQPGKVSAPLASIALNRTPAPPNCVNRGGVESFNWVIQFDSVPDHYIYWITDPASNIVYGQFTVPIQGQPSPVTGADNWPV